MSIFPGAIEIFEAMISSTSHPDKNDKERLDIAVEMLLGKGEAKKALKQKKRGRKSIKDDDALAFIHERVLAGLTPTAAAKEYAEKIKNHSLESTEKRLVRKYSKSKQVNNNKPSYAQISKEEQQKLIEEIICYIDEENRKPLLALRQAGWLYPVRTSWTDNGILLR